MLFSYYCNYIDFNFITNCLQLRNVFTDKYVHTSSATSTINRSKIKVRFCLYKN